MTISGSAKLAGVMGWPVGQSLSPALHGYWLAEHGIDGAYVPLAVRPEDFATVLEGLKRAGFRGVNVTLPHKQAAFALAARHDPASAATGAVNLLVFGDAGIEGRNTDTAGIGAALAGALGPDGMKNRAAVIWGAGGAARAAVYTLSGMGAGEIHILNRTRARAEALAAALQPLGAVRLIAGGFEDWKPAAAGAALLANTTSAGMKQAPSIDLPLEALPAEAAVMDVVYNPLETGLLARARQLGRRTIDGLEMLMHQAVPAFAAFYGATPRVTPGLRAALEKALGNG